ncbi:sodium- and chloride-dependent glycine transporter 1-like [Pecten maximus]|uniref:sodium- and chloride-dependent glycine transporter 1-like n=1 Tax=Pecten maximus TaxID=6579 RepID=UPI0014580BD7|nr:sodium- and chloride-dependent glycine transporter 1-like [Pecten maximus]
MKGNIAIPVGESETDAMFAAEALDVTDRQNEPMKLDIGDGMTITVTEVEPSFKSEPFADNQNSSGSIGSSQESNNEERAEWGGKMEFILTCVGYAVGLGNVWRFPYLCYRNGGGAFLIPYTLMLALVGLPLFYMELVMGQYASLGPIAIWKLSPLFKGLGYAMVIVSLLIGLYYNVVISHVLYYLFKSFTDVLPWESCDNTWNTNSCLPFDHHVAKSNTSNSNSTILPSPSIFKTPTEEYYRRNVLNQSESIDDFGTIEWHLVICLFIAWLVVGLVLLKGIQSLGKVVYFTAIFPYVMLTVLFVRGVTLPGASKGILYYLEPDFERLLDPRVWSDAATQIFYSLSACSGGLIAMSSYNKFNNNCYRDALIVCCINCGTSVFAGLVIFSVLGFIATEKNVDVSKVVDDGPGLAFIVYPEALARMPVAPMWSVFFFIMMATLGFGSQFSIVECVFSSVSDEFPILKTSRNNIIFRVVGCIIFFLLGLPMICSGGIWMLNLVDYSVGGFPLLVVGLMELLIITRIYGYNEFSENINTMLGIRPNKYWEICWKWVSPFVVFLTIILNIIFFKEPDLDNVTYPSWAVSLGWLIAMFPVAAIVVLALYYFCRNGGFMVLKDSVKPLPTWGPADKTKGDYSFPKYDVTFAANDVGYNPAFARLMGSNMSTSTNSTDVTNIGASVRTVNRIPGSGNIGGSTYIFSSNRSREPSESKV